MRPIEQSLENKLTENAHDRWLRKRYDEQDWNGLLEAALLLNTLYHMERTKSAWAIREAADNLADVCGYDRD